VKIARPINLADARTANDQKRAFAGAPSCKTRAVDD